MSDIIDINITPVVETITLTIEPNLTTINVNTVNGGGGAVDSVNGQTGVVVLDQDDIADGTTYKQYSLTEKNKLAGIQAGAEVNVNADWNATSGDALILNKPTIPSTTDFVPYTGATTNVNLGEFEIKAGQVSLDTSPTGTASVGTTRWNDNIGSSETTLKGGNVILKNGVDLVARIVNKVTPNTTLTKAEYQVVRVSGAQGQRLAVNLAQANNDNNSADTLGIVTETIATNQEGFIITVGQLENINTTGSLQGETWADGDVLYLSPTTAGKITNIKPTGASGHIVILGYVEYAHANNGKIYVKIMNGWELDELHNVFIDTPLNNQLLSYETATSLWKNKSIDNILGYTPASTDDVGSLIREEFTFTSSQTFTLANNYGQVYSVEVQGQGSLSTSQYTLVAPNQITINDTLDSGDYVTILYSNAIAGVQPYYSQAESDALFVEKVAGKQLSTEDYTTAEKSKLAGIEDGAQVNIVAVHNPFVIAGQVYNNAINAVTTSTGTTAVNRLEVSPLINFKDLTIKTLAINVGVSAVGGLARIVVYSDLNGTPNTKLLESPDLDCSTTGFKKFIVNYTFQKGVVYWIGAHFNSIITVRVIPLSGLMSLGMTGDTNPMNTSWRATPTYGSSSPNPFTGGILVSVQAPEIKLYT